VNSLICVIGYNQLKNNYHYIEKLFNHRLTSNHYQFFGEDLKENNILIAISGIGFNKTFQCLVSDLLIGGDTLEKTQCLSLYRYENGERKDNITDWALTKFREYYHNVKRASSPSEDKTIAEKFNNYRFADYKEKVIDLLMRVTTVSVETMKIINEMNKLS
jgi:predicted helicase